MQLWALLLPLGFGGVAVIGQLQGLTAATMGPSQRVSMQLMRPFQCVTLTLCNFQSISCRCLL